MISSIIADVDVDVDEPWGLFCFRQCLLIINRIKTEVPPGSWIWYLEAHLGSKRPTGLLPLDEEIFACQVDLFTLYDIIHSWHLAAYTWLIKLRGEICPSRHCRQQCQQCIFLQKQRNLQYKWNYKNDLNSIEWFNLVSVGIKFILLM